MIGLSFVLPCASYDLERAAESMKSYEYIAEEILVAVDDRMTWSGQPVPPWRPPGMFPDLWPSAKLRTFVGNWSRPDSPAMDNETAERNALSVLAKPGNWVVSLDADEYLVGGHALAEFLDVHAARNKTWCLPWLCIYKVVNGIALVIMDCEATIWPHMPVATFRRGVHNRSRGTKLLMNNFNGAHIVHWQFAGRTAAELLQKFQGWGHVGERDPVALVEQWEKTTIENHSAQRLLWPWGDGGVLSRLVAVPVDDLYKPGPWNGGAP